MKLEHFSNDNINIDLHIHSNASYYKDGKSVSNSIKENISILIKALEKNNINMFAITDHNRFDYDLYKELTDAIEGNSIIKKVLPGIEFDVQFDTGKPNCHIIAIFDDSNFELIGEISKKITNFKELKKEESYSMEEFETLIRKIGLKTILIVHQKQSLDNTTGKTDSLSAACDDPSYFIKTGYIDCLEFGSNRTEGIVKSSLIDLDIEFPLITGSDCHDWNSYPFRDNTTKIERKFTSIKCLPTFKGLLMAVSSFKSRANRTINSNQHYIKGIKISDQNYPLVNGINAIIGDNGSGKTLMMNLICNGQHKYYDKLIKDNQISYECNSESFQNDYIEYIYQGQINEKVRDGKLFNESSDYYDDIMTKNTFSEKIFNYFNNLNKYVMHNINVAESRNALKNKSINVIPIKQNFYFPVIDSNITLEKIEDDKLRRNTLKEKIEGLKTEFTLNNEYYDNLLLTDKIKNAIRELDDIYDKVNTNFENKEKRNKARSIISKHLKDYETSLTTRRTTDENKNAEIISTYNSFKKSVVDFIQLEKMENTFPLFPEKMEGISEKQIGDYLFTKTTRYNDIDLKDEFYKSCFNVNYNTEESIKKINKRDDYVSALKNCSSIQDIEKYKTSKIQGFVDEWSKESTFISEVKSKSSIGNTPGEIALVYYKFKIQEKEKDFYVLAIDQPEDDINPKRIKDFLIKFLSSIRDKKQVIIVTHNPLLVVNLDVDNVICLNKNNNKIEVKYGALEYDDEYSILDIIKDNLDGGYEAIEGRLKKYDRDNN